MWRQMLKGETWHAQKLWEFTTGINTPYSYFILWEVKYDKKMLVFDIYMAVLLRIQVF